MEVIKALEELRQHLESTRQFLGITLGLNKEECAVILRKLHALLPEEIRQAAQIRDEANRVLNTAKQGAETIENRARIEAQHVIDAARKDAEQTLQRARMEQDRMLNENEILRIAKAEADKTRAAAETEANRLRREADQYAHDVLTKLENVVSRVLGTVEKGRSELHRSLKPQDAAALPTDGEQ